MRRAVVLLIFEVTNRDSKLTGAGHALNVGKVESLHSSCCLAVTRVGQLRHHEERSTPAVHFSSFPSFTCSGWVWHDDICQCAKR